MKVTSLGEKLRAFLAAGLLVDWHGVAHADNSHHDATVTEPVSGGSHDHTHEEVETDSQPPHPVARLALQGASIVIRTGPPPFSETAPDIGTLLGTIPAKEGVGLADNSGTAGHYRIKDRDGRVLFQGQIAQTDVGDTTAIVVENNVVVAGGTLVFDLNL